MAPQEIIKYVEHGIGKRKEFNEKMSGLLGMLEGDLKDRAAAWLSSDSGGIGELEDLLGDVISSFTE
jgi:hypothetical protein